MAEDVLADIAATPDIKRRFRFAEMFAVKQVDAGRLRQLVENGRIKLGRQGRRGVLQVERCGNRRQLAIVMQLVPELVNLLGIGQRPVPGFSHQTVAFDQAVEIVPLVFRV